MGSPGTGSAAAQTDRVSGIRVLASPRVRADRPEPGRGFSALHRTRQQAAVMRILIFFNFFTSGIFLANQIYF